MFKRYTRPIMAVCLLGFFLTPAHGQQEMAKQEMAKQEMAKQEMAKQEAAKQEAAKQEAVKQEALKVGDKAPDFVVETLAGTKFKLSNQFGKDGKPTILLFSRANW